MLHRTVSFMGVGTETALEMVYVLTSALWTGCISSSLLPHLHWFWTCWNQASVFTLGHASSPKIFIIIIHIDFRIYSFQSSVNRPLYLTEHCCQHSSQSSISPGSVPPLSWLSIYFSNVLYFVLTVRFIIIPALRGTGCFFLYSLLLWSHSICGFQLPPIDWSVFYLIEECWELIHPVWTQRPGSGQRKALWWPVLTPAVGVQLEFHEERKPVLERTTASATRLTTTRI